MATTKSIHYEYLNFTDVVWLLATELRFCRRVKRAYYRVHEIIGITPRHIVTPNFYRRGDLLC